MSRWFVDNHGERFGPIPEDVLLATWQAGRIAPDALVCMEGHRSWVHLSQVPSIAVRLPPTTAQRPPAPRGPAEIERDRRNRNQSLLIVGGVIAAVAIASIVSGGIAKSRDAAKRAEIERNLAQQHKDEETTAKDLAKTKPTIPPAPPPSTGPADWAEGLVAFTRPAMQAKASETMRNYFGRDRFFFDHSLLGEIEISVSRVAPDRWQVILPIKSAAPRDFVASDGGLRLLVPKTDSLKWWRLGDGPFAGHFLFRTLGTIEVWSKHQVCDEPPPRDALPAQKHIYADCP